MKREKRNRYLDDLESTTSVKEGTVSKTIPKEYRSHVNDEGE